MLLETKGSSRKVQALGVEKVPETRNISDSSKYGLLISAVVAAAVLLYVPGMFWEKSNLYVKDLKTVIKLIYLLSFAYKRCSFTVSWTCRKQKGHRNLLVALKPAGSQLSTTGVCHNV